MAHAIEQAVRSVWNEGYCTADIAFPGGQVIGTEEMGARIAETAEKLLEPVRTEVTVA